MPHGIRLHETLHQHELCLYVDATLLQERSDTSLVADVEARDADDARTIFDSTFMFSVPSMFFFFNS